MGGHEMNPLAVDAIARTKLGYGADPRRYVIAYGYDFRRVTRAPFRAEVDGRLLTTLHHREDGALNVVLGFAIIVCRFARFVATTEDVIRLAACLAMPGAEPAAYLPAWFVEARMFRPSRITGSGVRTALRAVP